MKLRVVSTLAAFGVITLVPSVARAHCDTLDGPVVKDARVALDTRDVTPVLKWVRADQEGEIREAFERVQAVRGLGAEPRALADRFFFETLVRVHRAGEGEPFTGLQPAGVAVDPGIAASDAALERGSVEPLIRLITHEVEEGLRHRHAQAAAARLHATESVDKGREYVAAYVELMHYAEQVLAAGTAEHGTAAEHAH